MLLNVEEYKNFAAKRAFLLGALTLNAKPFDEAVFVNYMSAQWYLLNALLLLKVFRADRACFEVVIINARLPMVCLNLF